MSWTLNGTRIYAQDFGTGSKSIIARLQTIGGGTTLHTFGYESEIVKISAFVVTDADKTALEALIGTGLSYALVSPEGSLGNFCVSTMDFKRQLTNCIVLYDRPGLDPESPFYLMDVELFIDG